MNQKQCQNFDKSFSERVPCDIQQNFLDLHSDELPKQVEAHFIEREKKSVQRTQSIAKIINPEDYPESSVICSDDLDKKKRLVIKC